MIIKSTDNNATGAFLMMASTGAMATYNDINLNDLDKMFVMWQTGGSLATFLNDKNIPDHGKEEKLKKIDFCKKMILKNYFTVTTIFGMRKNETSPIVITDGIHRAIGIYRAIMEDPLVIEKITLKILLFTGEKIAELPDYIKSIESSN